MRYASSMEKSDSITAQVKARSRIFHWATLAYESTHYPPMIKIKNLDLSCDINHGSTIVKVLGYELHPRMRLSIKALVYPLNLCGVRIIPSAGRARDSGRKILVGTLRHSCFRLKTTAVDVLGHEILASLVHYASTDCHAIGAETNLATYTRPVLTLVASESFFALTSSSVNLFVFVLPPCLKCSPSNLQYRGDKRPHVSLPLPLRGITTSISFHT